MKPYGMPRLQSGDDDVAGCVENGRQTSAYSLSGRAYKSLRQGKKASKRRHLKRLARIEGKRECRAEG